MYRSTHYQYEPWRGSNQKWHAVLRRRRNLVVPKRQIKIKIFIEDSSLVVHEFSEMEGHDWCIVRTPRRWGIKKNRKKFRRASDLRGGFSYDSGLCGSSPCRAKMQIVARPGGTMMKYRRLHWRANHEPNAPFAANSGNNGLITPCQRPTSFRPPFPFPTTGDDLRCYDRESDVSRPKLRASSKSVICLLYLSSIAYSAVVILCRRGVSRS